MKKIYLLFLLLAVIACSEKEKVDVDVSDIVVDIKIKRFDQQFYTTDPKDLDVLKSKFPYLFPAFNPDSVWVNKMQDKDEQDLFAESQKKYKDFTDIKLQLTSLFKHIKYYYPDFKSPTVITMLTNVDYDNNVVLADSLLFISLDIFLGKDNDVYQDFPDYVKKNYTKDHLVVAVAEKFAASKIPPMTSNSFVSKIVQEGKKKALMQAFLPDVAPALVMYYTKEEYGWAKHSEVEVWKYFVQNKMLFDASPKLSERFINQAPFSKFFLEIDKDSPGRIGVWFGWEIVKSFMENNKIEMDQVMLVDNEELFKYSKYKPKK